MGCPSLQESIIVIGILALVFGASRLPQLGGALGKSIRNFKTSLTGDDEIDVTAKAQVEPGESEEPQPDEDREEKKSA
ncbi:MAG: twin-arginine translocase TatA/TatE family subunit [Myxococcota bacterium]